jgi:hypothetical protein
MSGWTDLACNMRGCTWLCLCSDERLSDTIQNESEACGRGGKGGVNAYKACRCRLCVLSSSARAKLLRESKANNANAGQYKRAMSRTTMHPTRRVQPPHPPQRAAARRAACACSFEFPPLKKTTILACFTKWCTNSSTCVYLFLVGPLLFSS